MTVDAEGRRTVVIPSELFDRTLDALRTMPPSDHGTEKLLRTLLDRAYKMLMQAGYRRLMEHDPDHNDPIIAWMADARLVLYGSTKKEPMGWL